MRQNLRKVLIFLFITTLFDTNVLFSDNKDIYDDSSVPPTIRSPLRFGKRFENDSGDGDHSLDHFKCVCTALRQTTSSHDYSDENQSHPEGRNLICRLSVDKKVCKILSLKYMSKQFYSK